MKRLALHWQIIIALVIGVLFGIFLKGLVPWVDWMGDIFLRALKMVVIPLILFSITNGVASIGTGKNLGSIGLKTMGFYIATTLIAAITGLLLVNIIRPGAGAILLAHNAVQKPVVVQTSLRDIFINIIPDNIFQSFTSGNTLQVILFAILFGFFITRLGEKQQEYMKGFVEAAAEVMMKITFFVVQFAPLGIFAIVARQVSLQTHLGEMAACLGMYMLVVIAGLLVHSGLILPSILTAFRINPLRHYQAVSSALITAFSTSSSNATLPLTMSNVQKSCGVSSKICSFTLPLGATINMNGTALYEIVSALFIAQVYGLHMTMAQQITGVAVALLAAIGCAGIPMAGMVTMTIVLTAMGLPMDGLALVLPVDRPLDMCRTMVNVLGDTCGAVVVAKTEGEKLNV